MHTWNMVKHSKDITLWAASGSSKSRKMLQVKSTKVCLVVYDFLWQYSVNYNETYTPVAWLTSLCLILILMIMVQHDWDIDVFNFHSAFLNGTLDDDEIICMELSPSFDKQGHNIVMQLCIAIYGFKQGMLKWYQHLYGILQDLGFIHMEADWGVFIANIAEHILILALHVDNCMITGSSSDLIKTFKDKIRIHFWITNLESISWLLGIRNSMSTWSS